MKWIRDRIQRWIHYLTSTDDSPCAQRQRELDEIVDQYRENFNRSDPVTQHYLAINQKPIINEEIAIHNSRCPHNRVAYL
jgi:hypothetical protein